MISHAWPLLIYAVLTIAYTWPMASGLGHLVPHDVGDPLLSTWTLWWNAQVLPFTERWWDGLAFFPAHDTLTFSDHRVGLGFITTPVMWFGGSPLAAHNIAFLLSFLLSAAAAYALCFTLTRNGPASFIGGLVFGFNPFRADHLPHLELLSSYWLPVVLLALHQWKATLKPKWLVLFASALIMQALTCGYYFIFLGVLLGLWLIWFTRGLPLKQYVGLASAVTIPLLVIGPILLKYRNAHRTMGLSRPLFEIEHYSADLIGLVTAPRMLALWNSPEAWQRAEGALLPGATAVALVAVGVWLRRSDTAAAAQGTGHRAPGTFLRRAALVGAAVSAGVALVPLLYGPVAYHIAGLRISVSDSYKPLSTATVFVLGWFLTSAPVRQAWRGESPFAFYVLATAVMWLLALGPTARLLEYRVLYKAPYSWLMLLPGFSDGFRVPARFTMLAVLTLSVAAPLAFHRLIQKGSARVKLIVFALVGAAIVAESWIDPLPTFPPPSALVIPAEVPSNAVTLELPLGLSEDVAAMYRSIVHGRRTVNGMSGFDAPHYVVLRSAIQEGRLEVLQEIAAYAPVAIFLPRTAHGQELSDLLTTRTQVQSIATTNTHDVLLLPQLAFRERPVADRKTIPVQQLGSESDQHNLTFMLDGNRMTAWMPAEPQSGDERFTADLGTTVDLNEIVLSQGASRFGFPRAIAIDISADMNAWSEVWRGDTAAKTVAAAITEPRDIPLRFQFATVRGRYVRVRQLGQSQAPWAVAEFRAIGPP